MWATTLQRGGGGYCRSQRGDAATQTAHAVHQGAVRCPLERVNAAQQRAVGRSNRSGFRSATGHQRVPGPALSTRPPSPSPLAPCCSDVCTESHFVTAPPQVRPPPSTYTHTPPDGRPLCAVFLSVGCMEHSDSESDSERMQALRKRCPDTRYNYDVRTPATKMMSGHQLRK